MSKKHLMPLFLLVAFIVTAFLIRNFFSSIVQAQTTQSKVLRINSTALTLQNESQNSLLRYEQQVSLNTGTYELAASVIPYEVRGRGIKVVLMCGAQSCPGGKVMDDIYNPYLDFQSESKEIVELKQTISIAGESVYKVGIMAEDGSEGEFVAVSLKRTGSNIEILKNADFRQTVQINTDQSQPKNWLTTVENWGFGYARVITNFQSKTGLFINSTTQQPTVGSVRYTQKPFSGGDYIIEASVVPLVNKGNGIYIKLFCENTNGCPNGKKFNEEYGRLTIVGENSSFQIFRSQTIQLPAEGSYGMSIYVADGSEALIDYIKLIKDANTVNENSEFNEAVDTNVTLLQPADWTSGPDNWGYAYGSVEVYCPLHSNGDSTCDGSINNSDYDLWKCEYLGNGTCSSSSTAFGSDFNSDEKVDLIDFEIWRSHSGIQLPTNTPTDAADGNKADLMFYAIPRFCTSPQQGSLTVNYQLVVRNIGNIANPANSVDIILTNGLHQIFETVSEPVPALEPFAQTQIIGTKTINCATCDLDIGLNEAIVGGTFAVDRNNTVDELNEENNVENDNGSLCPSPTPTLTRTPTPSPTATASDPRMGVAVTNHQYYPSNYRIVVNRAPQTNQNSVTKCHSHSLSDVTAYANGVKYFDGNCDGLTPDTWYYFWAELTDSTENTTYATSQRVLDYAPLVANAFNFVLPIPTSTSTPTLTPTPQASIVDFDTINPSRNANLTNNYVVFQWEYAEGATYYGLNIRDTLSNQDIYKCDETSCTYTPPGGSPQSIQPLTDTTFMAYLDNSTYAWSVKAWNSSQSKWDLSHGTADKIFTVMGN